jgi:RNA ligase (TIGR02306 family)
MKLATVETVAAVLPHHNADSLEIVRVLGYECIVQKNKFAVGHHVILIQPDTVLPDEPWAAVFRARSNRVKATKLRGVWSFGIVLPISTWPALVAAGDIVSGTEVSEIIGVSKYEPPAPQDLSAAGFLPRGLPKTDEERWQNFADLPFGEVCDITLKIDGSSLSVYARKLEDGSWETGVTSRSLRLKTECNNKYIQGVNKYDMVDKLLSYCQVHDVSLSLRGELYGNGIQGFGKNPHGQLPLNFAAFSVFNMDKLEYADPSDDHYYEKVCAQLNIPVVPMLEKDVVLTPEHIQKYSSEIDKIDGKPFEGVVVKHAAGSFKIINLQYDERK